MNSDEFEAAGVMWHSLQKKLYIMFYLTSKNIKIQNLTENQQKYWKNSSSTNNIL